QMHTPKCGFQFPSAPIETEPCNTARRPSTDRGIKVKIGTGKAGTAVRLRASLELPRHTTFAARATSCSRRTGETGCSGEDIPETERETATDADIKFIRANSEDAERGDAEPLPV